MTKIKLGTIRTTFRGKIFTIKQQPVVLPNGERTTFEYCQRPASVSVLAFDDKNKLLMIKEWRVGYRKNVWFLPGGRVDHPGDTPLKAAHRELREETGYNAKQMKLLRKKSPSNTLLWDIYIVAARDLFWDPLPPEPGEQSRPVFVPLNQAVQMALDGTIQNEFISYNIIRFSEMLKRKEFKW